MAAGTMPPDPGQARTPAEFVAVMRRLKEQSGLTYRQLSARAEAAGHFLPHSTLASALARSTLPREEVVTGFLRACGYGDETVDLWLSAYQRIATGASAAAQYEPDSAPASGGTADNALESHPPGRPRPQRWAAPHWNMRRSWALLGASAVLLGVWTALNAASGGLAIATRTQSTGGPRESGTQPGYPAPGAYRIGLVHSSLCLTERPGASSGRIYQAACKDSFPPRSLEAMEGGTWRIATDHPKFGLGCMGVMSASTSIGASLEDDWCGRRNSAAETFRLEPVTTPAVGYRLHPVHTDLCLGVAGDATTPWAEVLQLSCDPDAPGQIFRFYPVPPTPSAGSRPLS